MSEQTHPKNGNRRMIKMTVTIVISITVIGMLSLVGFFFWQAIRIDNLELIEKLSELLGTLAVMLIGGFLAIAKDLFKD